MEYVLFYGMAGLAVIFGLLVVFLRNPLHSALALIGLLFNTSALYAMLGGEFIAVIQVMVYTGAIMVLFVFVIMLLTLKKEPLDLHKLPAYKMAGAVVMLVVGVRLGWLLVARTPEEIYRPAAMLEPGFGLVERVGELILGRYMLPFEAVSVLLLAAIVGGVVLGKKRL